MKNTLKLLALLLGTGLTIPSSAQTTAFTATITDPSGVPYANCNWTATLIDAIPGTPSKFSNGTPVSPRSYSGQCNNVGLLAYSLWDNSKLSPSGSTWTFAVTDSTGGHAFTVSTLSVTGASQNSSASFTSAAPCFSATGVPCGSGGSAPGANGQLQATNGSGALVAANDMQKGAVNALTDCGLVGDGVHDDGPAMQACVNAHPGRQIMLPKTQASNSNGGTSTTTDYYFGNGIILKGNSQNITGNLNSQWSGGVKISFPSGVTAFVIPSDCYSCQISNLEIRGPSCWSPNLLSLWYTTIYDGIDIYGGEPILNNVVVQCFEGKGVFIEGNNPPWTVGPPPGQPDLWRISGLETVGNHASGFVVEGGDSSIGTGSNFDMRGNARWGVYEASPFGNYYISPHTISNGNDQGSAPGANGRRLSYIQRISNVAYACPSTNVAIYHVGDHIAIEANADSSFNGVQIITAVDTVGIPSACVSTGDVRYSNTGPDKTDASPTGSMGTPSAISSISRTSNIVTVVAADGVNTGNGPHWWITLNGTPIDGTYWTTSMSGNTATFELLGPNFSGPNSGYIYGAASTTVYKHATQTFYDVAVGDLAAGSIITRSANFTPHDVGSTISLAGAGAGGSLLTTTVASYASSSSVTLTVHPSISVSNATADMGGGWDGGPYLGISSASSSIWTGAYEELNQPPSKFNSNNILQSPQLASGTLDISLGVPTMEVGGYPGQTITPAGHRWSAPGDASTGWEFQAGTQGNQTQSWVAEGPNNAFQANMMNAYGSGDLGLINNQIYQYFNGDFLIRTPYTGSFSFNKGNGNTDFDWWGWCSTFNYTNQIMTLNRNGNFQIGTPCQTTSTSGNFSSPTLTIRGEWWNTNISTPSRATDQWIIHNILGTGGTAPTSTLRIAPDPINASPGQHTVALSTMTLDPIVFSALGTPAASGTLEYCSDCQVTTAASCSTATPASCVCTSGGSGAIAKYINYQSAGTNWYCQ